MQGLHPHSELHHDAVGAVRVDLGDELDAVADGAPLPGPQQQDDLPQQEGAQDRHAPHHRRHLFYRLQHNQDWRQYL